LKLNLDWAALPMPIEKFVSSASMVPAILIA